MDSSSILELEHHDAKALNMKVIVILIYLDIFHLQTYYKKSQKNYQIRAY